jgi:hypothetical protein
MKKYLEKGVTLKIRRMSCHCRDCGFGKKINKFSFVVTRYDVEKIVN